VRFRSLLIVTFAMSAVGTAVPVSAQRSLSDLLGGGSGAAGSRDTQAVSGPGVFRAANSSVTLYGRLEPAAVRPGQWAQLVIKAEMKPSWHVYAYAPRDNQPGSKPTLITLDDTSGLVVHRPITTAPIVEQDETAIGFGVMRFHEGEVTWRIRVDVPPDTRPGDYPLAGYVAYQACQIGPDGMGVCEFPTGARFATTLQVGNQQGGTTPLSFTPASYTDAKAAAGESASADGGPGRNAGALPLAEASSPEAGSPASTGYDLARVVVRGSTGSIVYYIALAFVGGIILNLMPCVLPVIGLKVMSFVEQAGKSRAHALTLNIWYAAGIVSVFLLLGLLAASIGLSWGGQFGSTAFNVTLAAIVFAMALSLLGVWEVPIPGFFGSGTAQELAAREGPLGAFLKGVVTTVLATPCTAPFMATAIAWAVTQPTFTTMIVFASLGLGMASPYLVVGVFPELLRFMPRPGEWMESFKRLVGFVLLATVVFILSFIEPAAVIPTLALLVGVGLACWLISKTPYTAELRDRLQTWALAGAVALLAAVVSFGWLYPDVMRPRFAGQVAVATADQHWQPFSLERLHQVAVGEGRTVLVDFSADWCFNCKTLEQVVLHTEPVAKAIADSGAVTMYADYTNEPPELKRTLESLKSNGVPVIAIFPGGTPYEPIVFRGGYTQSGLIAALHEAATRRPAGGSVTEVSAAAAPVN
jgi:suppressor for copper-sensitivity B